MAKEWGADDFYEDDFYTIREYAIWEAREEYEQERVAKEQGRAGVDVDTNASGFVNEEK